MSDAVALATVTELAAKLPFVMSGDEEREAALALETLSDDARHYGNSGWLNPATCPREVKNLVLKAANRHMKNYEGFTRSNAGDEGVGWTERGENPEERGSAVFAPSERERLRDLGGGRAVQFHSVDMFAFQTRPSTCSTAGYIPDDRMPFPMFADPTEPW